MSIIEAIILGIIQGLTEFIPVSSSGHLVLAHELFGSEANLAFDVALHGGTLLALVIYFYKDILRLAKSLVMKSDETKLAWLLAAATVPAVIAGLALETYIENSFRSSRIVAANLVGAALLMLLAEKLYDRRKEHTSIKKTSLSQALIIGCAQALALVPGVSRSGSTITAGLFAGMDRVAATRFAFLLGIPIITGALLKTVIDHGSSGFGDQTGIFIVGVLSAFVSGLFAIGFLLKYLAKHSLAVFAYYRITLALVVLVTML